MNIALIGYGKMGKEIERQAIARKESVKKIITRSEEILPSALDSIDVCIEFSAPAAAVKNITAVAECGKNIVVGTTGWYDHLGEITRLVHTKKIGLLYAPNFSIGMNIVQHLVARATALFDKLGPYDVSIAETHHREKSDSPSGTALMLGKTILQYSAQKKEIALSAEKKLRKDQLQITSQRVGSIVGTHTVGYHAEADSVEITHIAHNRQGFALGALVAAEWIRGKQGVFTLQDVLESV